MGQEGPCPLCQWRRKACEEEPASRPGLPELILSEALCRCPHRALEIWPGSPAFLVVVVVGGLPPSGWWPAARWSLDYPSPYLSWAFSKLLQSPPLVWVML